MNCNHEIGALMRQAAEDLNNELSEIDDDTYKLLLIGVAETADGQNLQYHLVSNLPEGTLRDNLIMGLNNDIGIPGILKFFIRGRPEITEKDAQTQLGVHIEEFHEMLEELTSTNLDTLYLLKQATDAVKNLAEHTKASKNPDLSVKAGRDVEFLDSLVDQIVTATGVAYTKRYDVLGAVNEVSRSNLSKFDENGNPIYDENKKIIKGPNYVKANLAKYVPNAESSESE